MTTYGFTVTLAGEKSMEEGDDIADALYGGRCDDAAVHSSGPTVHVSFDREAESLDAALMSALADLRTAGLEAARVEINRHDLAPLLAGAPAPAPSDAAPSDAALTAAA